MGSGGRVFDYENDTRTSVRSMQVLLTTQWLEPRKPLQGRAFMGLRATNGRVKQHSFQDHDGASSCERKNGDCEPRILRLPVEQLREEGRYQHAGQRERVLPVGQVLSAPSVRSN